ncbi:fumarylacetoacetate hydrolase family protein [Pelagovum sp. HNIBRBA483]|uniref:fumarylacetoacetate hydrolase family protein n=1 Tax=Pelagovum sp. HNIBRBA483 TaxID=3233341 RepID=UPI0034A10064
MKIASFQHEGRALYGLVDGESVRPVSDVNLAVYPTLRALLDAGTLADLPSLCASKSVPLASVQLLPPVPNPSKILCIGLNYKKPYPLPGTTFDTDNIVIFGRHNDSFVAHGQPLEMPVGEAGLSYDFEGEIAVVIGTTCRHVQPTTALNHLAGYACMNEGSVRGWQKHSIHAGKNFHASGAWGPWLATADETAPIEEMRLVTRVNGTVMQETTGAQMIHNLPKLISYLSHITQLNPGDVIATGSPDGTGGSRTPTAFLKPDDVVEVEVSTVGTLANPVAHPQN